MKEVTIKVPDKQFQFFTELIKKLGFEMASKKAFLDEDEQDVKLFDQAKKEDDGKRISLSEYITKRTKK